MNWADWNWLMQCWHVAQSGSMKHSSQEFCRGMTTSTIHSGSSLKSVSQNQKVVVKSAMTNVAILDHSPTTKNSLHTTVSLWRSPLSLVNAFKKYIPSTWCTCYGHSPGQVCKPQIFSTLQRIIFVDFCLHWTDAAYAPWFGAILGRESATRACSSKLLRSCNGPFEFAPWRPEISRIPWSRTDGLWVASNIVYLISNMFCPHILGEWSQLTFISLLPVGSTTRYGKGQETEALTQKLAQWLPRLLDDHDERKPKLRPDGLPIAADVQWTSYAWGYNMLQCIRNRNHCNANIGLINPPHQAHQVGRGGTFWLVSWPTLNNEQLWTIKIWIWLTSIRS